MHPVWKMKIVVTAMFGASAGAFVIAHVGPSDVTGWIFAAALGLWLGVNTISVSVPLLGGSK